MAAPQARAHQGDMHAPAPSAAATYSTPAQAVGSQFVHQYYTVLHSTPRYLHRFYTDISTMSHNDPEGGPSFTVQSQKEIHQKVMLLDFDEAHTEIWSVDCQHSAENGVLVQVAGSLQCKGKPKRSFVQTFFLAVQEKGYFVLNDIFRYLPELPAQSAPVPAAPSATPAHAPIENGYSPPPATAPAHHSYAQPSPAALPPRAPVPPAQPHDVSPTTPAPTPAPMVPRSTPAAEPSAMSSAPQHPLPAAARPTQPRPTLAAPAPEPEAMPTPQQQEPPKQAIPPEADPEPEPQQPQQQQQQHTWTPSAELEPEAAPASPKEPAVPLTYAQRLMVNASKASQQTSTSAPSSARAEPKPAAPAPAQASAQQPAAPKPLVPAQSNGLPIANGHADGYFTRDEGPPGTSIFVRNLPESITAEKLAEIFAKFGALRGAHPVSLKKQKDKDIFAFVDFQEPSAQQAAIARPPTLDGQQLQVVEKKPQFISRGRGRGGPPPGRGMFRGGRDGGRGYGRDGTGGRDGGRGRAFLERGASLNSINSDGGRGGRRGRGRDGPAPGGRGDARGGRNGGAPRPTAAPATAAPAAAAAEA